MSRPARCHAPVQAGDDDSRNDGTVGYPGNDGSIACPSDANFTARTATHSGCDDSNPGAYFCSILRAETRAHGDANSAIKRQCTNDPGEEGARSAGGNSERRGG